MSIEITGPERYEFQYCVTLELVLLFWANGVRAVVDSGGEDSTLDIVIDGSNFEIELQVKGAESHAKAIDSEVLREYLAHFPSRKAKNSLLERLLDNSEKLVLFVCTQRAMDFASPLVVRHDWQGKVHRVPPLPGAAAELFIEQLIASKPVKDTKLEKEREKALFDLGGKTTATKLNTAFQRLFVQDNVTKGSVIARLYERLRALGIPNDRVKLATLQMLQKVRDSKGLGLDVVPALREILDSEITPSVRPLDYVPRGGEATWTHELSTQRALLLSGPPRCGKTDAANWIASEMQSFGFDVVSTGLVEEAERVLLDNSRREILVVLDDPLGSDFDKGSRAAQALQRLQSLVRRIQPSRRLIVSQSQEALLSVSDCNSLDEVQTGTLQWHDLGICPPSFLTKVWNAQSQSNQVTETVREAVEAAIASGEIDVPAGVLAHLAAYHQQLEGADVVRLAQNLASESAADFASRLRAGGMQQVMRALAIGSTAAETSADRELAFILGEGAELDMPSEHDYWSLSPDEKLVVPELAPAYEDEPRLPEDAKRRLISLEAYRVVRRKRPDHFEFSHPYYRSVARHFVKRVASLEKDDLLTAIRRGLFSPSASTSGATARNLWWLHHDLASRLDLGEPLVHLAEKGLRWHFPATRDLCYQFLLEVVKAKPESYEDKLQSWVNSMSRIRLDDVIWERGEPYFPVENQHTNRVLPR